MTMGAGTVWKVAWQIAGGLGDGSPPAGSRGGTPVGGMGDEVPQKLKHFYNCDVELWPNFTV